MREGLLTRATHGKGSLLLDKKEKLLDSVYKAVMKEFQKGLDLSEWAPDQQGKKLEKIIPNFMLATYES
ncbi:hypothetical protein ABEW03_05245 [Virgibacillus pantothenticus]|uniref:hypothetical protein n=1 Tax=Virgibacillus pantothenticus TaxID=1473 RepID=UPI00095510A8|nr:hypothetical protein SAMN05421787_11247 [Virgibacillus pantothenticus]